MANRKELIEAMKVIKYHCGTIFPTYCDNDNCPIFNECNNCFSLELNPQDWDLEESETE